MALLLVRLIAAWTAFLGCGLSVSGPAHLHPVESSSEWAAAVATLALISSVGVGLIWVAVRLWTRRRWARLAAAVVHGLAAIGLAVFMANAGRPVADYVGVCLYGILSIVLLLPSIARVCDR